MRQTTCVSQRHRSAATIAAACVAIAGATAMGSSLPSGNDGLAANYPGDAGIENDPNVVFVENFESGTLHEIRDNWGFGRHVDAAMALTDVVPEGAAGSRSIRMSASPDHQGVELYKTFTDEGEGWEQIFLRFNVRFGENFSRNSHFVALRGFDNPSRMPGVDGSGAGQLAEDYFSITIEPTGPEKVDGWKFYAYWPNMRSWHTETGEFDPDHQDPRGFYGNNLSPHPDKSFPIQRGEWMTVEVMVKLNTEPSDPDNSDGELAFWIDGELAAHFAPGKPELGYWRRESWRYGPVGWREELGLVEGPFEGFRFRDEHMEDVLINVLRLQNYVGGSDFDEATVYFDNVVMATEYIGPLVKNDE